MHSERAQQICSFSLTGKKYPTPGINNAIRSNPGSADFERDVF